MVHHSLHLWSTHVTIVRADFLLTCERLLAEFFENFLMGLPRAQRRSAPPRAAESGTRSGPAPVGPDADVNSYKGLRWNLYRKVWARRRQSKRKSLNFLKGSEVLDQIRLFRESNNSHFYANGSFFGTRMRHKSLLPVCIREPSA